MRLCSLRMEIFENQIGRCDVNGFDSQRLCALDVDGIVVKKKRFLRQEVIFFQYLLENLGVGFALTHAVGIIRLVKISIQRLLRGEHVAVDVLHMDGVGVAQQEDAEVALKAKKEIKLYGRNTA